MIFEGQVFEDALMNPVLLAISTYLLGYQCVMSSMTAFVKGPNKVNLDLHCDTLLPNPLPDHALVCNCTYALTDYNKENGSIAFVATIKKTEPQINQKLHYLRIAMQFM